MTAVISADGPQRLPFIEVPDAKQVKNRGTTSTISQIGEP
jgi:hypothetical protein